MEYVTRAVLIALAVTFLILLICSAAMFLICYFCKCDDSEESEKDDEEKQVLKGESPLPKPDGSTLQKMHMAAPSPRATKQLQPTVWKPNFFTKKFKGPIVIHQWQPERMVHDLDKVKPPPQLLRDRVTFNVPANEVYEMGSTVEKLKLDDPAKTKTSKSDFDGAALTANAQAEQQQQPSINFSTCKTSAMVSAATQLTSNQEALPKEKEQLG